MKLQFQAADGSERMIAEIGDDEEPMKYIQEFCDERNFKIPYVRCWGSLEDDGVWYDVGSHVEFFVLRK